MKNEVRKNEKCVIGIPSCGYVFFSQPSCFIAYGFKTSPLEVGLVKTILRKYLIEPVDAGEDITPGENVFCKKICSRIIVSRFCISFLNYDEVRPGALSPNANVFMEYGLMLGMGKYVVPFQKEDHALPFNVSGLDTIKYRNENFESLAEKAIAKAVTDTEIKESHETPVDNIVEAFLLSNNLLVAPLDSQGEVELSNLGRRLGFVLLNDFYGVKSVFLGNFINLKVELIVWKIKKIQEIMKSRISSIRFKAPLKGLNEEQIRMAIGIYGMTEFWVLVDNEMTKEYLTSVLGSLEFKTRIDSMQVVMSEMADLV